MSSYRASLSWSRGGRPFETATYGRDHEITYGSGVAVPASASSGYGGDDARVNPEEQLAGALSSCHMLTFLAIAVRKGYVVESYRSEAEATLATDENKRTAVTAIQLRPTVVFSGDKQPSAEDLVRLHESAHRNCFIANSIKAVVTVSPG